MRTPKIIVETLLHNDPLRWRLLGVVRDLNLPDCWIGAGFIRNAVWDHLHGRPVTPPKTDIDVIYFNPANVDPAEDRSLENRLRILEPDLDWDVKNQARMHARHGDAPYESATDALSRWSETATAFAVRRTENDEIDITAPYGLDDLVNLVLRPPPRFVVERGATYRERLTKKRWLERWPLLQERFISNGGKESI